MNLYHYTCRHGAAVINRTRVLRPNPQPFLAGRAVVWATDLDVPDADALGLTRTILDCDRTAVRYVIADPDRFVPWFQWWPGNVAPVIVPEFTHPPRQPRHWYIATEPVGVRRR